MVKAHKTFWIIYLFWVIINLALLVMAFYDVFGEFDRTTRKFWPFTVGSPKYYDFFELLLYLGLPILGLFIYRLVHHPKKNEIIEDAKTDVWYNDGIGQSSAGVQEREKTE